MRRSAVSVAMAATLSVPAFAVAPADAAVPDDKTTGQCNVPGKVRRPWVNCGHLTIGPAEVLSVRVLPFWKVTKADFEVWTIGGEKLAAVGAVDARTRKPREVWTNPSTSLVTVNIKARAEKKGFLQAEYRTRTGATSTVPFRCAVDVDSKECGSVKVPDKETVWVKLDKSSPVTTADFDANRNPQGFGVLGTALTLKAGAVAKPVWTNDTGKATQVYMRASSIVPLAANESPTVVGVYFTRPGEPEETP
jgi:hypothetical protein